jgi:hypothetical protein
MKRGIRALLQVSHPRDISGARCCSASWPSKKHRRCTWLCPTLARPSAGSHARCGRDGTSHTHAAAVPAATPSLPSLSVRRQARKRPLERQRRGAWRPPRLLLLLAVVALHLDRHGNAPLGVFRRGENVVWTGSCASGGEGACLPDLVQVPPRSPTRRSAGWWFPLPGPQRWPPAARRWSRWRGRRTARCRRERHAHLE